MKKKEEANTTFFQKNTDSELEINKKIEELNEKTKQILLAEKSRDALSRENIILLIEILEIYKNLSQKNLIFKKTTYQETEQCWNEVPVLTPLIKVLNDWKEFDWLESQTDTETGKVTTFKKPLSKHKKYLTPVCEKLEKTLMIDGQKISPLDQKMTQMLIDFQNVLLNRITQKDRALLSGLTRGKN